MPASKRRNARQRSFEGCVTCRSRHLKCDEARPLCTTCHDAGLKCSGYQKAIFFESSPGSSSNAIRFRRPLYSEKERNCMSEALVKSVPAHLALWHIDQIDQKGEKASLADTFQACHGPFGAFRLVKDNSPFPEPASTEECWNAETAVISSSRENQDAVALSCRTPSMLFDLSSALIEPLPDIGLIQDQDFPDFSQGMSSFDEMVDLTPFLANSPLPSNMLLDAQDIDILSHPAQKDQGTNLPSPSPELTSIYNSPDMRLPHDAIVLVKHYSTTVLRALTPFRHTKTPWHILFLPHAKTCLAALTLGENLDHASLCAFYGILSVSAFSLGAVSQSSTWLDRARTYKLQARHHAKYMLKTAYDVPKTAKYKSILVALLTMVQVAMVSGDLEQTDCYFIEAEKFIRLKGLNRKKSRKVRLLHHCYAFERMFHESTFVAGLNSSHRQHVRKAIESSGAIVHSYDSLTFRLGDWGNLEDAMAKIKDTEEGENDLHLEVPGIWSATLYPEIFGVPEVYVFLLSVTIRLGEQKDAAQRQDTLTAPALGDFMIRAKAIERSIHALQHYGQTQISSDGDVANVSLKNMLTAMQNALSIYFYRRIYDIDTSILQPKVEIIKDCLIALGPPSSDSTYGLARLIWPAFIAGCESEDLATRSIILDWLDNSSKASGSHLFSDTKANIERLWAQRLDTDAEGASWLDLLKTNKHIVSVF